MIELLLVVIVLLLIWIGWKLSDILKTVEKLEPPKEE
jgi:hypothetical protein